MYLDFFKFQKNPFHITPDPEFLFLSPSHKEASASIFYGIEARKGFIAITGEVGVGKTTILRSYLEGMDSEKARIVYIFNAALSFQKLLKQILLELGIQITDEEPSELVNSLHLYLIEEYKHDRNVVLIIDEAQNMPIQTLEHLRMLSNLETSQDKLIQIILVGQPEFDRILNLPELRQLKQRIAIRCRIDPLSPDESLAYIQHRLTKASAFHNPVFTKGALKKMVKEANGIPRIINVIGDNALITAFGYEQNPVDSKIIKEVIADLQGGEPAVRVRWRAAVAVSMVVIAALLFFFFRNSLLPGQISPVAAGPPALTESVRPAEPQRFTEPKQGEIAQEVLERSLPGSDSDKRAPTAPVIETVKSPKPEPNVNVNDIYTDQSTPTAPVIETAEAPKPEIDLSETNIKAGSIPVAAESGKHLPKTAPMVRIVKKGDTVFKLLEDICGRLDEPLVKRFKDLNPQIKNLNKVEIGDAVVLPGAQDPRGASN